MANESLYTDISSFANIIYEGALSYARTNFVATMYTTVFNDTTNMETRSVTEYRETPVTDNLAETADLSTARQKMNRTLLSSLTPKEVGKQIFLSYVRLASDPESILADSIEDLGYTIGKKLETDALSHMTSLASGTVGTSGSAFSTDRIFEAQAILQDANLNRGGLVCVMSPMHYLAVAKDLADITNTAGLDVQNRAWQSYFVGSGAGMDFVVSPNVPYTATTNEEQTLTRTGSPTGGTFTISFKGRSTGALAYNASAGDVETALENLASIGTGNVSVAFATNTWTVTFQGALAGRKQTLIVLADNSLTGGTSPTIAIARSVAGAGYATAGVFSRSAIAIDIRRNLLLEPEKDASARGWELNASMIYATGVWKPDEGVQIIADATSPVS